MIRIVWFSIFLGIWHYGSSMGSVAPNIYYLKQVDEFVVLYCGGEVIQFPMMLLNCFRRKKQVISNFHRYCCPNCCLFGAFLGGLVLPA